MSVNTKDQVKEPELKGSDSNVFTYCFITSSCTKTPSIVFLKTHKAASSTVTVTLQRYGLKHNKTFAIPLLAPYSFIFHLTKLFTANMTMGYQESMIANGKSWEGFDILMNHARLNRQEMDKVVQNAFYLTILRNPTTHFESTFGYFKFSDYILQIIKEKNATNEMTIFLNKPKFFYDRLAHLKHFRNFLWNSQSFDLGLNPKLFENDDYVSGAIQRLSRELDLVMIMEYFDESLIMMKKELCLDYEDIIYMSSNARKNTQKSQLDYRTQEQITEWNKVDTLLYKHFNDTLWLKILDYGPNFSKDLAFFRQLNQNVRNECTFADYSVTFPSIRCEDLKRLETGYINIIRAMTKKRFNFTEDITGLPFTKLY
ncbi:galactosylceramide sulfotransferase-like [Amphiura filiformis]|uniref:galactosylceramide sulfotransferase-like n=1 Tax=Amphiura filiformis TaxID=82378 RepID=UPI003B220178